MEIGMLNTDEYDLWNKFVDDSDQATIYGKSYYLNSLKINYKILAVTQNDKILGGIVLTKNELNLYSNPLLVKYLGIFFGKFEGKNYYITSEKYKISELILNYINKYSSFDYSFHPSYQNWLPFYWQGYKQQTYYTYTLDYHNFSKNEFELNLKSKLRTSIKRMLKDNFSIDECIPFETFYEIIEDTYVRQGGKAPFNKAKIENMVNNLRISNNIKIFGIKDEFDSYQAVAALVYDNYCANLIFTGYKINTNKTPYQDYLIYHTIMEMSKFTKIYDFEGSMIKSIESYYRKFGGKITPYYRISKSYLITTLSKLSVRVYKKFFLGK